MLAYGGASSQFDITDQGSDTFRYTWDGTGTDPLITPTRMFVGDVLVINGDDFDAANNLTAQVTAVGDGYFEITNASGVAESGVALGATGSITVTEFYGTPMRVAGEDGIQIQLASASSGAATVKIQMSTTASYAAGAVNLASPDFYLARSPVNHWDFAAVYDNQAAAFVLGDTGFTFAGTDADNIRNALLPVAGATWICAQVTNYTAGDIYVNGVGFTTP